MALTIEMNDEWEDAGKDENMGWIRRIGRDETSDGKDGQTETMGLMRQMMEQLRRMNKDEMIGRMSQMMMQMSRIWD